MTNDRGLGREGGRRGTRIKERKVRKNESGEWGREEREELGGREERKEW